MSLSSCTGLKQYSFTFNSYEKEGGCDENNISATGGNKSQNMGQNCMHCHVSGGEGEGYFTAAGIAYDSLQTSTLHGGKLNFSQGLMEKEQFLTQLTLITKGISTIPQLVLA